MQQALSSNIPHALTLDVAERLWELASHTLIYIFFEIKITTTTTMSFQLTVRSGGIISGMSSKQRSLFINSIAFCNMFIAD